jgi:parallel beta-helix repeat protein
LKTSVLGIILIIMLGAITLSVIAFTIYSFKASPETIHIRGDGSISPSTANITTMDKVNYVFIGNNYDPIVVERSNITIDGNGHMLEGSGATDSIGIDLTGIDNVTIENMAITAFYHGISLKYCSGISISGDNVTASSGAAIYLNSSSSTSVSGNNVTRNSGDGIRLEYSSGNSLNGNNIIENGGSVTYGPVTIAVWLSSSYGNIVSGNNITSNSYIGIEVDSSTHDNFTGNSITANDQYGIFLDSSSHNTVSGNNVTSNGLILNEAEGIALAVSSNNNTVSDNNVTSNGGGISVTGGSSGNTVSGNNITGNNGYYNGLYGLCTYSSSGNKFYHNNIVHNMGQFLSYESVNVWDNGYPSGGNYWSDYNGTDLYSGPYQNITGSDGIGDTPYNNMDRYPLLTPFTTSNPDPRNGMKHSADVFSNSLLTDPASNAAVNERPESPCAEMRMCRVYADQERANKKTHARVREYPVTFFSFTGQCINDLNAGLLQERVLRDFR